MEIYFVIQLKTTNSFSDYCNLFNTSNVLKSMWKRLPRPQQIFELYN